MKMRLIAIALLPLAIAACKQGPHVPIGAETEDTFTILAGSELKHIETGLKGDINAATGLDLTFTYSGTLDAIDKIAGGAHFDALWVSHGKYLAMNDAMKGRILAQEKTMLSPVL